MPKKYTPKYYSVLCPCCVENMEKYRKQKELKYNNPAKKKEYNTKYYAKIKKLREEAATAEI